MSPQAYTVDSFAEAHGIGRNLTYDEMKSGRLRFKKCGRKTIIPAEAAADWLRNLPDGSLQEKEGE